MKIDGKSPLSFVSECVDESLRHWSTAILYRAKRVWLRLFHFRLLFLPEVFQSPMRMRRLASFAFRSEPQQSLPLRLPSDYTSLTQRKTKINNFITEKRKRIKGFVSFYVSCEKSSRCDLHLKLQGSFGSIATACAIRMCFFDSSALSTVGMMKDDVTRSASLPSSPISEKSEFFFLVLRLFFFLLRFSSS